MKTIVLHLSPADDGSPRMARIKAARVFEHLGHQFAVHRPLAYGGEALERKGWRISEVSTGQGIGLTWSRTIDQAIVEAKAKLGHVISPDKVHRIIKEAVASREAMLALHGIDLATVPLLEEETE